MGSHRPSPGRAGRSTGPSSPSRPVRCATTSSSIPHERVQSVRTTRQRLAAPRPPPHAAHRRGGRAAALPGCGRADGPRASTPLATGVASRGRPGERRPPGSTSSRSSPARRGSRWPPATSTPPTGSSSTTIGIATSCASRCSSPSATPRCSPPSTRRPWPPRPSRSSSSWWPRTGTDAVPADLHPLDAAGRLVQEDLCLMVLRDGAPAPRRRVALLPVLLAPRRQARPSDGGRCTVRSRTTATSWPPRSTRSCSACVPSARCGVATGASTTTRRTSSPTPPHPYAVSPPEGLYLRSERQTLRRLTTADVVLFTIRTQQVPLAVLAERPDVAHRHGRRHRALVPRPGGLQGRPRRAGRPALAGEPLSESDRRSLGPCSDATRTS